MRLRSLSTRLALVFSVGLIVAAVFFAVIGVREVERLQRAESVRDLARQARAASRLARTRSSRSSATVLRRATSQDMTAGQLYFASYLNLSLGVNETHSAAAQAVRRSSSTGTS